MHDMAMLLDYFSHITTSTTLVPMIPDLACWPMQMLHSGLALLKYNENFKTTRQNGAGGIFG